LPEKSNKSFERKPKCKAEGGGKYPKKLKVRFGGISKKKSKGNRFGEQPKRQQFPDNETKEKIHPSRRPWQGGKRTTKKKLEREPGRGIKKKGTERGSKVPLKT